MRRRTHGTAAAAHINRLDVHGGRRAQHGGLQRHGQRRERGGLPEHGMAALRAAAASAVTIANTVQRALRTVTLVISSGTVGMPRSAVESSLQQRRRRVRASAESSVAHRKALNTSGALCDGCSIAHTARAASPLPLFLPGACTSRGQQIPPLLRRARRCTGSCRMGMRRVYVSAKSAAPAE